MADENIDYVAKVNYFLHETDENGQSVTGGWMEPLLPHLKVVSVDPSFPHPKIVFSFTSQAGFSNRLGMTHGGATATLFDFCTSMPLVLIGRKGFWQNFGVTRTLNVTYLRPIPAGLETLVECEILQVGKKVCTVKGVMRRKDDGQIVAVCEHGRVNIDAEPKV